MVSLFALQLALPLVLAIWIAILPPRSLLGFWVQTVATTSGLVAVGLTGLWSFLPWWTSYAFGGLFLLAILVGWRRRRPFTARFPKGVSGWAIMILFIGLGGMAIKQTAMGLADRNQPPAKQVNLTFPLKGSTYLIVNGGGNLSINAHIKTLDSAIPRFRAWRGQSYGVDIVKINRIGLRATGLFPSAPNAYYIYDNDVLAPCTGEVITAIDGLPDMQVPETDRAHMAGNHVVLRCGEADIVLGHFQPGSLKVSVGSQVRDGDRIAAVGNSGNSDEPHLHIHAQQHGTTKEPMSGNPLPMRFKGRFLVRNDRVSVP